MPNLYHFHGFFYLRKMGTFTPIEYQYLNILGSMTPLDTFSTLDSCLKQRLFSGYIALLGTTTPIFQVWPHYCMFSDTTFLVRETRIIWVYLPPVVFTYPTRCADCQNGTVFLGPVVSFLPCGGFLTKRY